MVDRCFVLSSSQGLTLRAALGELKLVQEVLRDPEAPRHGSDSDDPGAFSSSLGGDAALPCVITSLPPEGPDAIASKAAFVVGTPSGRGCIALARTTLPSGMATMCSPDEH